MIDAGVLQKARETFIQVKTGPPRRRDDVTEPLMTDLMHHRQRNLLVLA